MAGKATALQRAAVQEAKLQKAISRRFHVELQESLVLLNRRIRSLLRQLDTEDGRLVSTQANLGRALQLRTDLQAEIRNTGLIELSARAVDAPLDRLTAMVLETSEIAAKAAKLTPLHVEALTAFKELRLAELLEVADDAALMIWRATVDGVLGVRPVESLLVDIEDALEATRAEARTVYDTAVSSYSRQVEQLQTSGEPDELFLYTGPADDAMRPFCKERVGKVFSRSEIEEMDNGQIPNVFLTGGGYNCRHQFKLVSRLDDELQDLADSGTRLPEVERQLAEVA